MCSSDLQVVWVKVEVLLKEGLLLNVVLMFVQLLCLQDVDTLLNQFVKLHSDYVKLMF